MCLKLSSPKLRREMTKTECEMARDAQLSLSKSLSSSLSLCTDVTIGKDRTTPPDWKNVIFPGHSVSAQVFSKERIFFSLLFFHQKTIPKLIKNDQMVETIKGDN